jgi:L-fuconolactonase
MKNSPKIARLTDSHIHFFSAGFPGAYGALFPSGGELRTYDAIRAVHNIERSLIVGYEGDAWAAGNNRYIAGLAKKHEWMAPVAFCFTDAPPTPRQLQSYWKSGFYGISLYINGDAEADGVLSWPTETLDSLNERQAIISINVPVTKVTKIRPFLERLPGATVLLSHLGLPGKIKPNLTEAAARKLIAPVVNLAELPQIGVKYSGFYDTGEYPHTSAAPVLDLLRSAYGDKRLYWGSDFVPALDFVSFPQTIEAARLTLSTAAQAKAIFADNLTRALDRVQ